MGVCMRPSYATCGSRARKGSASGVGRRRGLGMPPETCERTGRDAPGGAASARRRPTGAPINARGPPGSSSPGALPRAKRAASAGGALPSHRIPPAVLSALAGLTSGFGMGPGVPPPPRPPADAGRSPAPGRCPCADAFALSEGPSRAPWGPHGVRATAGSKSPRLPAGPPAPSASGARGLGRLVRLG